MLMTLIAVAVSLTQIGCTAERQVGAAPASPIKARFVSDGGAQISVVVRPAAEIKPTFLQARTWLLLVSSQARSQCAQMGLYVFHFPLQCFSVIL